MKKSLLLLSISLITSLIAFGQVPPNDLIENATLINAFPFTDSSVRLDLATASGTNDPSGCPLGNYKTVNYKFTATESSQFEVFIKDINNADIVGSSFTVILSAPSLNVTDETELSIETPCGFGTSMYIDIVQGTTYYIIVHRNESNALSNIIFESTPVIPVPTSERDALIALYNSTNGDNWNNNTNWNSAELVGNWYGIRTTNINGVGHVSEISLGSNNLTGTIPVEIGNFPELTSLDLWSNQLTGSIPSEIGNLTKLINLDLSPNTFSGTIPTEIGNLVNLEVLWLNQNGLTGNVPSSFQNLVNLKELHLRGSVDPNTEWSSSSFSGDFPDLTALPLEVLDMKNNFFQFEDVADEFATYQANIPDFTFAPQYTVDPPEEILTDVGEDITLTITDVPGTNRYSASIMSVNNYQWLKDGSILSGANSSSYTITNAQNTDSGIYSCEITNVDVPGFIITRSGITVDVGGTLGVDENNLETTLVLYPNPSNSIINIKLPELIYEASFTIYDMLGKKIHQSQILNSKEDINISHFKSGIYLAYFKIKDKTIIKKLVKK